MPDPAALDHRAAALRRLADDVDVVADAAVQRAGAPTWQSPHAEDVRAGLVHTRSRARTAADGLRAEATAAELAADGERDRRAQERIEQERAEQERIAQGQPGRVPF